MGFVVLVFIKSKVAVGLKCYYFPPLTQNTSQCQGEINLCYLVIISFFSQNLGDNKLFLVDVTEPVLKRKYIALQKKVLKILSTLSLILLTSGKIVL